ncbi:hypothetical protein ACDT12_13390, partial [Staphylococcus aureus]
VPYSNIVNLCKKITDWSQEGYSQINEENDGEAVPLQLDDDEEYDSNKDFADELVENDSVDDEESVHNHNLKSNSDLKENSQKLKNTSELRPRDIDAFWLQRQVSKFYIVPHEAQNKTTEIFEILKSARDTRDVEM